MCMQKVDAALNYDKNLGAFVGYGYKAIIDDVTDSKGNLKPSAKRWKEATFTGHATPRDYLGKERCDEDYTKYSPGFHIFLNQKSAEDYRIKQSGTLIVKVAYREIVAIGTNETDRYPNRRFDACVCARYMKIVEVIKKY